MEQVNVIIIPVSVFTVLWLATVRVHPVQLMNAYSGGCRTSNQANWLGLSPPVCCYHPHPPSVFVLTQQEVDSHFTIPWRVEGCVDLGTAIRFVHPVPKVTLGLPAVHRVCSSTCFETEHCLQCLDTMFQNKCDKGSRVKVVRRDMACCTVAWLVFGIERCSILCDFDARQRRWQNRRCDIGLSFLVWHHPSAVS